MDKGNKDGHTEIAYLVDKVDKNDFMHLNVPYSLAYVPPPHCGSMIVN